jgi:hypothetical protein
MRPTYGQQPSGNRLTIFYVCVGLLVAVVMLMIIYDRVTTARDNARYEELAGERVQLAEKLLRRQAVIEDRDPRFKDVMFRGEVAFEQDAEWKKISRRLSEVEYEMGQINRRRGR